MNNFERIKAMDIDEMVTFFTEEYDSDFTDGYCIPVICYACKTSNVCETFKRRVKQWLKQESEEE